MDFASLNRTRYAIMSAKVYRRIIETRTINETYRPMPDVIIGSSDGIACSCCFSSMVVVATMSAMYLARKMF